MFQQTQVDNPAAVAKFARWFVEQGRLQNPVSVAFKQRQRTLAFGTRDEVFVVNLKSPTAPMAMSVVRTNLIDQQQQSLLARDLAQDILDLTRLFVAEFQLPEAQVFYALFPQFVGDLTSAGLCIGHDVTPASKFRKIADDAYDIALLEPQYAHGAPRYYGAVALPLQRVLAEAVLFKRSAPPSWFVSYDKLWVRTLAYFTNDPTLGWALQEGRDPFEAVGRLLKCTPEEAEVVLLWQACGRDIDVFARRFPSRVQDLPEDIKQRGEQIDRSLNVLALACVQMQSAYFQSRNATSLYGRILRPGSPTGEAVAFRVFGAVEELVANVAVTLHNWRPSRNMILSGIRGGPAAETIRIEGYGTQMEIASWLDTVRELSTLGRELGNIPLAPQVVMV